MRPLAGLVFLAMLAAGLWFTLAGRRSGAVALPAAVSSADRLPDEVAPRAPGPTRAATETERLAPAVAGAPATTEHEPAAELAALRVEVLWEEDEAPAVGVRVLVLPWGAPEPFAAQFHGTTDLLGAFERDGLAPGKATLYADRGGSAAVDLVAGETATVRMRLAPGIAALVRVVDEQGAALAGATVWLSTYGNSSDGVDVGTTDLAGRLRVDGVGESRAVAAWKHGYQPSPARDVHGVIGGATEIELVLASGGAGLRGVVRGPRGEPLAGAQLLIDEESSYAVRLASGELATTPPPRLLVTDAAGAYEALGLPARDVVVRARWGELAPFEETVALAADEVLARDLDLGPGSSVRGTITAGDAPAEGVFVGVGPYGDFLSKQTRSARDGSYRLAGLPPGRTAIRAAHDTLGDAAGQVDLDPAREARWDVALVAGDVVGGVVLGPGDAPLSGWRVTAEHAESPGLWLASSGTGADGAFRLENCPEEAFVIRARPRELFGGPASAELADFERGRTDLVLRVPAERLPSASLRGSLALEDGATPTGVQLTLWSEQDGTGTLHDLEPDASFLCGSLLPGTYRLTVLAQGAGERSLGPLELAPNEARDLGRIVLQRGGTLRARFTRAADGAPVDAWGVLRSPAGDAHWLTPGEDGAQSGPLPPGPYTLVVTGTGVAHTERDVEITPGEATEVEVALERGTLRVVSFTVPPGCDGEVAIRARDAAGRLVVDTTTDSDEQGVARVMLTGLTLGRYEVEAACEGGARGGGALVVESLEPDYTPVALPLR